MENLPERKLIDHYIDAYNAFDIEGMLTLLDSSIRFENFSDGQLTTKANSIGEFRKLAEHARSLFSEREQRITEFRAAHDRAIVKITYRGVLATDIPNGPSAGTILELNGQSEFSFENGKISKIVDRS